MRIYHCLFETYGPQEWWPGETPLEIMIGAVLTQNTAWSNVERAIVNLKEDGLLTLEALLQLTPAELAERIRPAGYFNVKARRLLSLCRFLADNPVVERLPLAVLRERLLGVHGIGPETADDILLYAFERPVFVIDAYTRRLFSRLGLVEARVSYETLRRGFEQALGPQTGLYNEFHALIVHHAKSSCRTRPQCATCCLRGMCKQRL